MAPGHDIGWIRRPDGVTIYTLLRKRQKRVRVPASAQLYRWGLELMRGTDLSNLTLESMLAYRDGLIVAIFAARARRLKSMASVCVDEELLKKDGLYRIELKPEQVKTNRPDEFWLPHALVPYVDAYLAMVRPALAAGHNHAALFVGQSGRALTSKGLAIRISVLSQRKFGYSFGPHAFRHALSTMLAEYDPANPGLAAGVLGIGPDVNARHYDRAKQSVAARSYSDLIDRKRIQLRLNIKR
jgi:integrase